MEFNFGRSTMWHLHLIYIVIYIQILVQTI